MVASKRFSKGGSSAFLKTLKSGRRPERRGGVSELVPIMIELESSPKSIDELAKRFPLAERIVYSLVADRMVERIRTTSGEETLKLTPQGREFLKRRSSYV